jgi:hypothetical protein
MKAPLSPREPGPELGPATLRHVEVLFPAEDRERVKTLLYEECGNNLFSREIERLRIAALKCSDGNFPALERAVNLGKRDYRDLLMAAGFGNDAKAHLHWEPKPAGEPAEIDSAAILATIHRRLAPVLEPFGFERRSGDRSDDRSDEWSRGGEVPQTLSVKTGATTRMETRFFLRVTLDAKPVPVVLHLPRLARPMEGVEQGYIFRAHEGAEKVLGALIEDVVRYACPWFARFHSNAEILRGFEDGSFGRHLSVDGQAWIF